MIVVGLTGSIAAGKSTVAQLLREAGLPVFDADAAVHELYQSPQLAADIEQALPGSTSNGRVDRQRLAEVVLGHSEKLLRLESIVHPAVQKLQEAFVGQQKAAGRDLVIMDIPLLFETRKPEEFDAVILVDAPESLRRNRAMKRSNMTAQKFDSITERQMKDIEKRKRARFIIINDKSVEDLQYTVKGLVQQLQSLIGKRDA